MTGREGRSGGGDLLITLRGNESRQRQVGVLHAVASDASENMRRDCGREGDVRWRPFVAPEVPVRGWPGPRFAPD